MNRVAFKIRLVKAPPEEPETQDYFAVDVFVDGHNFLELVREAEKPFAAAEGHPDLAGKYQALPADLALSKLNGKRGEKVALYDCECGCFGCWPLKVRIAESGDFILWSEFEQPHRGPKSRASSWRYDNFGPFQFDREQYGAALAKAKAELRERRPIRPVS